MSDGTGLNMDLYGRQLAGAPSLVIDDSPPKDDGRSQEELAAIGREWLDAQALQSPPPNPSGITPTEFKVLIDPTPIDAKVGSIIIPEVAQEREQYAQIKGRIVARSPHAFSYASKAEWDEVNAKKPGPGDVVIYAKYAGVHVKGKDGKKYLIVNDKDICAVLDE